MKHYGELPEVIDKIKIDCKEMMFYQYLPIKLKNSHPIHLEERLLIFEPLIKKCLDDFEENFGLQEILDSYIYLTAKREYQIKGKSFNREGRHSDGFLTDDINYIWCDKNPTIFNTSKFELTLDDCISIGEMKEQALIINNYTFDENTLLRLDQFNIHKVNDENVLEGMRTFVKVSFSKDKYDLEGNARNYQLDYDWKMKPRKKERNIPQSTL